MPLECPKCWTSLAVGPNEQPRPWCPRCGTDVKALARTASPEPVGASVPSGAVRVEGASTAPAAATGRGEMTTGLEARAAASRPAAVASDAAPDHEFRPNVLWQMAFLLPSLVCFGIVAVALNQLRLPAGVRPGSLNGLYAVSALFGVFGLVMAYGGLRLVGTKFLVYPDRLVHVRPGGSTTYPWNRIRAVLHSWHPMWQRFEVATGKGQTLTLTGEIWGHKRLGNLIAERVAREQLPALLASIESGHTVTLGPISADRTGVSCGEQHTPWQHILSLSFGMNPIPQGPERRVSNMVHLRINDITQAELGEIPNYRLFEMLVLHHQPACMAQPLC